MECSHSAGWVRDPMGNKAEQDSCSKFTRRPWGSLCQERSLMASHPRILSGTNMAPRCCTSGASHLLGGRPIMLRLQVVPVGDKSVEGNAPQHCWDGEDNSRPSCLDTRTKSNLTRVANNKFDEFATYLRRATGRQLSGNFGLPAAGGLSKAASVASRPPCGHRRNNRRRARSANAHRHGHAHLHVRCRRAAGNREASNDIEKYKQKRILSGWANKRTHGQTEVRGYGSLRRIAQNGAGLTSVLWGSLG